MPKEIERKYIADLSRFDNDKYRGDEITQAYLSINPDSTVRIRIRNDRAFLTIKSKNIGAVRGEWEYEIPAVDAQEMISQCKCVSLIEKTRYIAGRWEVDVFKGRLKGLVLAEIELSDPDERFDLPEFIVREVTDDPRYYNSNLGSSEILPPMF